MQSEDAGFPASSLSAHKRYWVDTPARGCLSAPMLFVVVQLSFGSRTRMVVPFPSSLLSSTVP